jgi:hypothetical protein
MAREDYRSLAEIAPQVPAALDAICRKALAFDPADRFDSAAAFASAIEDSFRHDVATRRELAQFMSSVAADKVRREREAVLFASQAVPGSLPEVLPLPASEASRRGRFSPIAAATNNPNLPAEQGFFDPEAPAATAPWQHLARRAGQTLRTWAMASTAARAATRSLRASRPPDGLSGSLYEAVAEALFHRRREEVGPMSSAENVTVRTRAFPLLAESFTAVITRRVRRVSVRPLARVSSWPPGLDGPTIPRPAARVTMLATLRPPPRRGGLLGPIRALMARLWSRLAA